MCEIKKIPVQFVHFFEANPCSNPLNTVYELDSKHLDNVQDFLIKLGIKPRLNVLKISIFSLNHIIVRPNKIMNNLLKDGKIRSYFQSHFSV